MSSVLVLAQDGRTAPLRTLTTVINSYLLLCHISHTSTTSINSLPFENHDYRHSSRMFRLALSKAVITAYGTRPILPPHYTQKSYYTRHTSSSRYSLQRNHTSLPPPTGSSDEHQYVHMGGSRVGCAECRFILRGMKWQGA